MTSLLQDVKVGIPFYFGEYGTSVVTKGKPGGDVVVSGGKGERRRRDCQDWDRREGELVLTRGLILFVYSPSLMTSLSPSAILSP